MDYICGYTSPFGRLVIASDSVHIKGAWFAGQKYFPKDIEENGLNEEYADLSRTDGEASELFRAAKEWLAAYFAGRKPAPNDLPLAPGGIILNAGSVKRARIDSFSDGIINEAKGKESIKITSLDSFSNGIINEAGSMESVTSAQIDSFSDGMRFRAVIWRLLCGIPYGETTTYGELAIEAARLLGKGRMSAQAVGGAVGRNPISIIIPCHRVVGKNGSLTGYAGGLEKKTALLRHESLSRELIRIMRT